MDFKVSVIIPCRNEEKFIGKCLESLVLQDYPKENLEILVVDGVSEDGAKKIVEDFSSKYNFIKLLNNSDKFTPFALNIGIKNSKGEIVIRMDSHADYQKDYISKCVKYLKEYKADNVGGVIKTMPRGKTLWAKAIAFSLSSFFGVGTSYFRKGVLKPKFVDTVFGGCYKREVFDKVGLFNEKLLRGQDIEFNRRLRAVGGKILLVPDIVAYYYPQATIIGFLEHNFIDGFWTIYPLSFGIRIFSWRHLLPLFFVSGLMSMAILSLIFGSLISLLRFIFLVYLLSAFYFSFKISFEKKDFSVFFLIPLAFLARHLGYGLGSLWSLFKLKLAKV
ncbi:MAG: glycosyltransferase family 2 protein [Candidatus Portnoybacteria bacterium]